MSTRFSMGQMNQLGDAFEREGWMPDDVTKLGQSPRLSEIRKFLNGYGEITVVKHVIDCDADPHVPSDWDLKEGGCHKKGGQIEWDPKKIQLYLSEQQKNGRIDGNNLRKELENHPVLNANVLDYLLKHPELIPEEWKGKYVFFWGTIYRYLDGRLCVRYLFWDEGKWVRNCYWLDNDFYLNCPAVLLASIK